MKKPRRKKLAAPAPIDVVLDESGEDRFAPFKPPIPDRIWRAAVGARIADRARPQQLERGVLTVKAATSVWANELSMLAQPIVARLRNQGIEVSELRFRVGPVEPPARPPERRVSRAVPPPAPLPPDLGRALRGVADDELRETIALAARANLAWQDHVKEPAPSTAMPPAARAPRSSGRGSDPPGRT